MEGPGEEGEEGGCGGTIGPTFSDLLEYQSRAADLATELSGVRKRLNKLRAMAFSRNIQSWEMHRQWNERSYLARLEYVQLAASRAQASEAFESARVLRDQMRRSCDLQDMLYDDDCIRDDEHEVIRDDTLRVERVNAHRMAVTAADHIIGVVQDLETKMRTLEVLWAESSAQARSEWMELDAAQTRAIDEIAQVEMSEREIMRRLAEMDSEWNRKFM
jgi:hypothetical protein